MLEVLIDYKTLKYFMTNSLLNQYQARWSKFILSFKFKIIYKLGKVNVKLDVTSC
jgi:hypothetical protein